MLLFCMFAMVMAARLMEAGVEHDRRVVSVYGGAMFIVTATATLGLLDALQEPADG